MSSRVCREDIGVKADLELTDPQLGIFNNRYLYQTLPRHAAHARSSGQSLSVVMADVDLLKQINVNHGHETGDAVLQHVVSLMRSALRQADWIARYGGEEFVIVLPDTHLDGAYAAAERMRRRCAERAFALSTSQFIVTSSFGVACIDALIESDEDVNAMLQDAGEALRESKRGGRNRVTCGPSRPVRIRSS
jgi:two-component system cell cycle response regulator